MIKDIVRGSKLLLFSVACFFLFLQLGQLQSITNLSFSLHEIMYIPVNLGLFIIPIFFIILITAFLKYIMSDKKESGFPIIIFLLAIISFVLYISFILGIIK